MALELELQTFEKHLPELLQEAGKYVLIRGEEIAGTFDSYSDALKAGYAKYKLDEFLIKQIAPIGTVMSFSRSYNFAVIHQQA